MTTKKPQEKKKIDPEIMGLEIARARYEAAKINLDSAYAQYHDMADRVMFLLSEHIDREVAYEREELPF